MRPLARAWSRNQSVSTGMPQQLQRRLTVFRTEGAVEPIGTVELGLRFQPDSNSSAASTSEQQGNTQLNGGLVRPSVCLSVCLSVFLSFFLSFCLSVCLSVSPRCLFRQQPFCARTHSLTHSLAHSFTLTHSPTHSLTQIAQFTTAHSPLSFRSPPQYSFLPTADGPYGGGGVGGGGDGYAGGPGGAGGGGGLELELNLANRRIYSLSETGFNWNALLAIKSLDLSRNQFAMVSARTLASPPLPMLRHLDLSRNHIERIDAGAFDQVGGSVREKGG